MTEIVFPWIWRLNHPLHLRTRWMRSQWSSQFEHDHRRRADRAPQSTASFTRNRRRLTGAYRGGSLDRTETVPKWPRKRRAPARLREASQRDKSMRSWSLNHSLWKCSCCFRMLSMPKYSLNYRTGWYEESYIDTSQKPGICLWYKVIAAKWEKKR